MNSQEGGTLSMEFGKPAGEKPVAPLAVCCHHVKRRMKPQGGRTDPRKRKIPEDTNSQPI